MLLREFRRDGSPIVAGAGRPARSTIEASLAARQNAMQVQDPAQLNQRLSELKLEHRDLDAAIDHLAAAISRDELQLTRLKKRKLLLKDAISRIESRLIPDLDA